MLRQVIKMTQRGRTLLILEEGPIPEMCGEVLSAPFHRVPKKLAGKLTGKGRFCLAQVVANALTDPAAFPACVLSNHRDLALRALFWAYQAPGISRKVKKWDIEGFFHSSIGLQ